jgi:hypothetical protein
MKKLFENWRGFINENADPGQWYRRLTKPTRAEGPSPAFRIKLSNGETSEHPRDYPTESDITKDPNFCVTNKYVDGGYRSNKPLVGGHYLHLYFDKDGWIILKDMNAPKGRAHTGGSHYDYFGVMKNVAGLKCQYEPFGIAGHSLEVGVGKIKDWWKTHIEPE